MPLRMRPDIFRPQTDRQTPFRESDRERDWTEWRCRPRPSRGYSFAGRPLQSSANKEQSPRIYESKISGERVTRGNLFSAEGAASCGAWGSAPGIRSHRKQALKERFNLGWSSDSESRFQRWSFFI